MLSKGTTKESIVGRFRRDESGATVFGFALGLTLLLGGMGIGMDVSMAKKSKSEAQSLAESLAREASEFVLTHQRPPMRGDDAFLGGVVYSASDAGRKFGRNVDGNVKFKLDYSPRRNKVVATVWGTSRTTLISAFGYSQIDFEVEAYGDYPA